MDKLQQEKIVGFSTDIYHSRFPLEGYCSTRHEKNA